MISVDVWFGDEFIDRQGSYGHKTYESWAEALRSTPDLFKGRPFVSRDTRMVDNVNCSPINNETRSLLSGWSITEALRIGFVLSWSNVHVGKHRNLVKEDNTSFSEQIREIVKANGVKYKITNLFPKHKKVMDEVVDALNADGVIGARLNHYTSSDGTSYVVGLYNLGHTDEDESWACLELSEKGAEISFHRYAERISVPTARDLRKEIAKAVKDPDFASIIRYVVRDGGIDQ